MLGAGSRTACRRYLGAASSSFRGQSRPSVDDWWIEGWHRDVPRRRVVGATCQVSFSTTVSLVQQQRPTREPSPSPSPGEVEDDDDDPPLSPLSRHASKTTEDLIQEYSQLPQTQASLQMLLRTGRGEDSDHHHHGHHHSVSRVSSSVLIHLASLLRKEIPIRLAHRIQDLEKVPLMKDMPSVQAVKQIYQRSFELLVQVPPIETKFDEREFATTLQELYGRHAGVLVQMARGAYELRQAARAGKIESIEPENADAAFAKLNECHAFLDRFYMSRIGIRVLAGQYLALREAPTTADTIGMVCLTTSPFNVVQTAAENAKGMCQTAYGRVPEINISGRLDLTFPYIPTYLHYVLLELLKNALRATCEAHGDSPVLPPVTVIIADGMENEDIVIKIADEGAGIPRSQIHKIWSYLYTTADPAIQEGFIGDRQQDHDVRDTSPIAGLGYGLPISRSYCRYFGGAMDLVSMEGYGTDAFIHLKRLTDSEDDNQGVAV